MDHEHANPARAIYGTILVMAVITALSHDDSVTSAQLIAGVLATTFVFWIAHVYAEVLGTAAGGRGGAPDDAPTSPSLRAGSGRWSRPRCCPCSACCSASSDSSKTKTAVGIAIGAGVVELFGYGIAAGRRLKLSLRGTIVVGVVNGTLGLLIVLLKVLVH